MNKKIKSAIYYVTLLVVISLCVLVPEDLPSRSMIMAGSMLVFAIVNWICETVPIAITSLSIIALVPFTGMMNFALAIEKSFGNTVFAFFLGVLLLSFAFKETKLGQLITQALFRLFGKKARSIVLGIMIAGAALAMWITEVAAAAVVFPIAMSIWEKTKGHRHHAAFGKALMLGVAWGCAFGGVATPIATGANLIAVNYLESQCGIVVTFLEWMCIGLPISVALTLVGWILLTFRLPDEQMVDSDTETLVYGRREKALTAVFATAIVLWTVGSKIGLSSHHVALLAALALFLPGIEVLEWKKAISSISWDSIMLIASGIAGDVEDGKARMMEALRSGAGLKKLREMIVAQGGDGSVCDDVNNLPQAAYKVDVPSPAAGYVAKMDTTAIGYAAPGLGAGRVKKTDVIDPAVGLVMQVRLGDYVRKGDALATLYINQPEQAREATARLQAAITLTQEQPELPPLVYAAVSPEGIVRA